MVGGRQPYLFLQISADAIFKNKMNKSPLGDAE